MSDKTEALAALAHEQWSGWMRYLFSKTTEDVSGGAVIPRSLVERWRRQMSTPYDALPEEEKDSDRKEAARVLEVLS